MMQPDRNAAALALDQALRATRRDSEGNIEAHLGDMLRRLGLQTEHQLTMPKPDASGGILRCDIHVPECRLTIEVKAFGQLKPRVAMQQLDLYQARLAKQFTARHKSGRKSWWGLVTDGRKGLVREYDANGLNPKDRPDLSWPDLERPDATSILQALERGPLCRVDKPWANDSLYEDAFGRLDELVFELFRKIERQLKGDNLRWQQSVGTKLVLWHDQMRAPGIVTGDITVEDKKLFAKHTLLRTVARLVPEALTENPEAPSQANNFHGIGEGFSSWLASDSEGIEIIQRTWKAATRYEWGMRDSDVLRTLYQDCIDPNVRRLHGEFYTPDYLAQLIAEEILDNEWCTEMCTRAFDVTTGAETTSHLRGWGVLDPTCGSGTFLYHAARRLTRHPIWEELNATPQQISDSVARSILGIDIHPVAVEMTRATVLRALPTRPSETVELQVGIGDCLLADQLGKSLQFREIRKRIGSDGNDEVVIPEHFITHPETPNLIERFVDSAAAGKPFPTNMPKELNDTATKRMFSQFTKLCEIRGDSVWAWWLRGMLHPLQVQRRGVNRILANPPWVRMAKIQDEERQDRMLQLAKDRDIWVGGKQASSFDICAIVIAQAWNKYTAPEAEGAWVTNAGSLKAGTWSAARETMGNQLSATWDLSGLRKKPFHGANSAVWFTEKPGRTKRSKVKRFELRTPKHLRVDNRRPLAFNTPAIKQYRTPEPPPQAPSDYKPSEWRAGASIQPYCLVLADPETVEFNDGRATGMTYASRHAPWKAVPAQQFDVPAHWLTPLVTSKGLLPFALNLVLPLAIIPQDIGGGGGYCLTRTL